MNVLESPYAPPKTAAVTEPRADTIARPSFTKALLAWGIVCVIGAGPSFLLGIGCSQHPLAIPLMVSGIALFAVVFAAIRISDFGHRVTSHHLIGTCIKIGFGLRIALSALFPIGIGHDGMVGSFSMNISSSLTGGGMGIGARYPRLDPVDVFVTTLTQGVLLNLEILCVILLALPIAALLNCVAKRNRQPEVTVAP